MKDYKVISEVSLGGFQREVNRHLKEGYSLVGGVSYGYNSSYSNGNIYLQAVAIDEGITILGSTFTGTDINLPKRNY